MIYKKYAVVMAIALGAMGQVVLAEQSESISPSTCYVSVTDGAGLMTCANEKSEISPLQPVAVTIQSTNETQVNDLRLTVSGVTKTEDSYGSYILDIDPHEQLQITIQPLSDDAVVTLVGKRSGGSWVYCDDGSRRRAGPHDYLDGNWPTCKGRGYPRGEIVRGTVVKGYRQ